MARSKRKSLWVIFFGPQQHKAPGTKYYDQNGEVTSMKHKAAKFYTFDEAKEFAEKKEIELSSIIYIGQEDFLEHEIYSNFS